MLDGLDDQQRAAASVEGGPLLIVAGPGTGKTRTVTHRIAHLILERDVPARECLAITFTRRAAEEMTERLHGLVGEAAREITVATFHSFGLRLLREYHDRLSLSADFGIADATAQWQVLTEVTGNDTAARKLQAELPGVRRGHHRDPEVTGAVARYTAMLRARNLVDFDELVVLAVRLLDTDAEARRGCRERFRWITVDEYQDVEELQYRLLRLLAPPEANLTAIGDPDQAIYTFRGADVGFFLRFERDYPQAPVVRLSRNYRSGRHIVRGAAQAIGPDTLVADRHLHPVRQDSEHRIVLHHAADERAEAAFVVQTIDQLLGGATFHSLDSGRVHGDGDGGIGFSDIAVLYRTDAQSRAVLEELTRHGYPVQKRSHDPLTARTGVGCLLRELVHSSPNQGPGLVIDRVRAAAKAVRETLPVGGGDLDADLATAVELLTPLAHRCGEDIERFRHELLLGAEVDALDPRADAVSLLTLHASKGLEYPVVFLMGCEDGLLPLRWAGEPGTAAAAEERRLFFVGITRAQDRLYLTRAARRARRTGTNETRPSPFLAALGDEVTEESARVERRPRPRQLSLI